MVYGIHNKLPIILEYSNWLIDLSVLRTSFRLESKGVDTRVQSKPHFRRIF